jgi:aryl carrier-like protein
MAHRTTAPELPGWAPLAGPPARGRRSYRGGRFDGRWLLALAGIAATTALLAALVAYLLVTDPTAGLSTRSLLVLALAAVVVLVLVVRSNRAGARSVLRTLAEYVTVAALAVLLATTATTPPPGVPAVGRDQPDAVERQQPDQVATLPPGIRHVVGAGLWVAERWRQADAAIDRQEAEASTPPPRR